MQIAQLQAEPREAHGSRAAQRLRRQGKLPGVVYGHGETPQNVVVPAHDFGYLLGQGTHVVELSIGQNKRQVLIRDVQFDHMGAEPIHVDFTLVDLTERIHLSVPLEFRGTPVGTHEGGMLDHGLVDLEVSCLVTEIPSSIRVSVGEMKLGDILHVRDLELPPNIKAITPPEAIVCSVRAKTAAAEVVEEVEGEEGAEAEPEIIGRKEKEEEEEAGGAE